MHSLALLSLALSAVDAFPFVLDQVQSAIEKRDFAQPGCKVSKLCDTYIPVSNAEAAIPAGNALTAASAARSNCGELHSGMCTSYDKSYQYVSTSGNNRYIAPSKSQIRGPCPGLNAAANHNYLPRTGLATILQTITGLGGAYGMSPDLAGFLAAYAIALDGDVVTGQWSIGGPIEKTLLSGVSGDPSGISYSHNNYEGDTSIGRCDAYINGGDAHSLSITRFATAYASGHGNPKGAEGNMRYTLDTMSRLYAKNTVRSIKTNPRYFAPLFSTTAVSPAAYNFVINFMSNHSAAEPAGYLNGQMFKEFFAVAGNYPNFKWLPGQERIPENWYKRPFGQDYNAVDVFGDLGPEFLAYPDAFRFGGNTNGVNTYTGIDIANFTNGAYNAQSLFKGNNLGCFVMQGLQQALPTVFQNGVNDAAAALALVTKYLTPIETALGCPSVGQFDSSVFQQYKGSKYSPAPSGSGPANC